MAGENKRKPNKLDEIKATRIMVRPYMDVDELRVLIFIEGQDEPAFVFQMTYEQAMTFTESLAIGINMKMEFDKGVFDGKSVTVD